MTATIVDGGRSAAIRAQLAARLAELQAQLASGLTREAEASFGVVAGEVRDAGDESVATEHTEVCSALMQRHARELSDLQSALVRLDGGSYGACVECGFDIEPARLAAVPAARRCSVCQQAFEHRAALRAVR
jgi:RNA polymerase-binding transcription factor DksA